MEQDDAKSIAQRVTDFLARESDPRLTEIVPVPGRRPVRMRLRTPANQYLSAIARGLNRVAIVFNPEVAPIP
jgi:hypothetical protein